MVNGLKLQAAVKEVQPFGAVHIHGGAKHLLGERLMDSEVSCTHGEMAERYLDMKGPSNHVADQYKRESSVEGWY